MDRIKLSEQVKISKMNSSQHGNPSWKENSKTGMNFQSCETMWADMNCSFFFLSKSNHGGRLSIHLF